MTDLWLLATSLPWGAAILGGLWFALESREQWLIACLLLAFAYLVVALGLERAMLPHYLIGLRWGLFLATLGAFVRYRRHPSRNRPAASSAEASEAANGSGERPQEEKR